MYDTTHPLWCVPARCEAPLDGGHSAEPLVVAFDAHYSAFARLRLWQRPPYRDEQGIDHTPQPLIELVAGDGDTGELVRADLTLEQSRELQKHLITTLIAAGDDDTHDTQKAIRR